ncbi:MAG: DUF4292 domain-containing protein [Candidatus Zixiibacteriota bacterium]
MRIPHPQIGLPAAGLYLSVLLGFLLLGCAPKPRLLPENRTPEGVLKCARENRIQLQTFACLANLKLKDKEAGFSGTVEFYYQAPGEFAFYPRSLFGMDLFKAKGENDSLTIYFPKENEYFRGSFSDFEKSRLWSGKIAFTVLLDVILGRDGLMEQSVRYEGSSEDLFLFKSEDDSWAREYWVDPGRCRLKKSTLVPKGEERSYQIEYRDFARYDQAEMAKSIRIKSGQKESAQITFLERRFNLTIPPRKLELQIPPDAKPVIFENSPH